MQYSKAHECYIFLSPVTLSHPFMVKGPIPTHKRPPMDNDFNVPHDSIVARPGIPNGQNYIR